MRRATTVLVVVASVAVLRSLPSSSAGASEGDEPSSTAVAPTKQLCQVEFVGSSFLSGAHARGIAPASDCLMIDLPANQFFAPPERACSINFGVQTWLVPGWRFVGLEGSGTFASSLTQSGLEVKVEAGGGFLLKSVRLVAAELMEPKQCDSIKVPAVLR